MKLKVYSPDGNSSQEKEFAIPTFEGDRGVQALRSVLLALASNARQGTSSTLTRSTVSGTGKKPFKQKGLGRARQGSMVAPQMPGGAIAHGPHPRDWSLKVNAKVRRLAFGRALFDRAAAGEVAVIERFDLPEAKTKHMDALLGRVAPSGRILLVDDTWSDTTIKAARNLARVDLAEAAGVNARDLSDHATILVTEKGLERILARTGA